MAMEFVQLVNNVAGHATSSFTLVAFGTRGESTDSKKQATCLLVLEIESCLVIFAGQGVAACHPTLRHGRAQP
jgi:hypothetical protein